MSRGMSLVEVLVAVAVLGAAVVGVMTWWGNQMEVQRSLAIRYEIDAIRQSLTTAVDCRRTLGNFKKANGDVAGCPSFLPLIGYEGETLLASNQRGLGGQWLGTAACGKDSIDVRIEKRVGGQVAIDPFGQAMGLKASFNPIIGEASIHRLCAEQFGVRSRVATLDVAVGSAPEFGANGFKASDCAILLNAPPSEGASPWPKSARADNACHSYCSRPEFRYKTGYMVDCQVGSGRATCTCIR